MKLTWLVALGDTLSRDTPMLSGENPAFPPDFPNCANTHFRGKGHKNSRKTTSKLCCAKTCKLHCCSFLLAMIHDVSLGTARKTMRHCSNLGIDKWSFHPSFGNRQYRYKALSLLFLCNTRCTNKIPRLGWDLGCIILCILTTVNHHLLHSITLHYSRRNSHLRRRHSHKLSVVSGSSMYYSFDSDSDSEGYEDELGYPGQSVEMVTLGQRWECFGFLPT